MCRAGGCILHAFLSSEIEPRADRGQEICPCSESAPQPEGYCAENPTMVAIGCENYFLGGDGPLMPVRKDQPPPDLRYFNASRK
jgi:hypothetical protein